MSQSVTPRPDYFKEPLLESFSSVALYHRASRYFRPYLFRMALGLLAAIGVGVLEAVMPLGIKFYMEIFLENQSLASHPWLVKSGLLSHLPAVAVTAIKNPLPIWVIPVAILTFTSVQGVLSYLATYMNAWVGQRVTFDLKSDLFARLLRYEARFFDATNGGEVYTRFCGDVDTACSTLLEQFKLFLTRGISAVALSVTLLVLSWKLAVVAILVLTSTFVPLSAIRKRLKRLVNQAVSFQAEVGQRYVETARGSRVISGYSLYGPWQNRLQTSLRLAMSNAMKNTQLQAWITPMTHAVAGLGLGLVLLFGTLLIQSGELSLASCSAFLASLLLLYTPVKSLGSLYMQVQTAMFAMQRVFLLMDREPSIKTLNHAGLLNGLGSGIVFNNVTFAYQENRPVLRNLSFTVKPGQKVALVGHSGSGKTTIASLIPRFYEVNEGAILINGHDLRTLDLVSLRSQMALVFQDNALFGGTLRENILLGRDFSEEQLAEALEAAYLTEFVAQLPSRLETLVGDHGVTLSGGQRQRVAIARALLAQAPLVILDEATSALDNVSEAMVQKALDRLMEGKTAIVIAHRLSTVQNADVILVLEEGELKEAGSHTELLAQNGIYAHLYHTQFAKKPASAEVELEEAPLSC